MSKLELVRMRKLRIAIVALVLVLLCGAVALSFRNWILPAELEPGEVQKHFRNYPPDVLGLQEPVDVARAATFEDGGTLYIVLSDGEGNEFAACLDGRGRFESTTFGSLFINAIHPSKPAAKPVPNGGSEEAALYGVLRRWLDRYTVSVTTNSDSAKAGQYRKHVDVFLRVLEKRLATPKATPDEMEPSR